MIAEPLTRPTRHTTEFVWGWERAAACKYLRYELIKNAVLACINDSDSILLRTDASKQGVGGIYLQQQMDDWRLICCCSRRLSPAEINYCMSNLEGLAIIYVVTKFRLYLLCWPFKIMTDHCALCMLSKKTPHSPRLTR